MFYFIFKEGLRHRGRELRGRGDSVVLLAHWRDNPDLKRSVRSDCGFICRSETTNTFLTPPCSPL